MGRIVYYDYNGNEIEPPKSDVIKQTNADRIRAVSDEELAELIASVQQDIVDYYSCKKHVPELPVESKIWLDWLKQEAEE